MFQWKKLVAVLAAVVCLQVPAAHATTVKELLDNAPKIPRNTEHADNGDTGLTWPRPTPGMMIGIRKTGGTSRCTLGFFAKTASGQSVMITASHCFKPGDPASREQPTEVIWSGPHERKTYRLGSMTARGPYAYRNGSRPDDFEEIDSSIGGDFAIVRVEDGPEYLDSKIAGVYHIVGVAKPEDLEYGMSVCKFGYRTQETCGRFIEMKQNGGYRIGGLRSGSGDSGGPAYVKVGGNNVLLLGLHVGGGSFYDPEAVGVDGVIAPVADFLATKGLTPEHWVQYVES